MELGICLRDAPAAEIARLGRFAEGHGYTHVFVPDVRGGTADPAGQLSGRDAFVSLGAMFAVTATVRGAVGVAAVPFHRPTALAQAAATLTELSGGRFLCGIGVSHRESTELAGVAFPDRPVSYLRGWVQELARRSDEGMAFGRGFPTLVGALGPRMVRLGAAEADGVVLNWLTPAHAKATVDEARAAAAGRVDREPLVVLYVRISPGAAARADAIAYDSLAHYHQHFVAQGLDTPEAIMAGACLAGDDPARARDRIAEYAAAGIDLLCLYPHGFDEGERELLLERLAGAAG
jgi:alkanesulfonate monooxygenase SsuD/methylene tetrahydromethanopterin reductase-like flavin-dependent oxidoreductase (luciferase family)